MSTNSYDLSSSTHLCSTEYMSSSSFWSRRSRLERWLLGSALILLATSLALGAALFLSLRTRDIHNDFSSVDSPSYADHLVGELSETIYSEQKLCLTPACIDAAHRFLENMNSSADPCHDLYEYACGGFGDKIDIPEDKNSVSSFVLLEEELKRRLGKLLNLPEEDAEPETFRKMKRLYKACRNETLLEVQGAEPLRRVLQRLGGWPVVDGSRWIESDFDWQQTHRLLKDLGLGIGFFVDISVSKDMKNSSRRVIELDQPSLGMPDRAYLLKGPNDTLVQAYFHLMTSVALALGANNDTVEVEMMAALQFETKLANFSLPKEERRNFTRLYHRMRVADLSSLTPQVEWVTFLNLLLDDPIFADDELVVNVPSYLEKVFKEIHSTPKRVLANYLMWRVASSTLVLLNKEFRDLRMGYVQSLTGQAKETPRWLHCTSVVSSAMPNALGAMYVRRYFRGEAKKAALDMVTRIRNRFASILGFVDWMDNNTRQIALKKLDVMKEHVAFPDELLDDSKLNSFYAKMQMNVYQHFHNVLGARRFAIDYAFDLLKKPVNKSDWIQEGDAAEVNAYYNPPQNSIHFPAGILQGVFFHAERPHYLNYGAIGFVIGHEITHGFDDQGRQFDADGNLVDWWEATTDQQFRDKTRCLVHQYGNFTVPENGMKVNGINTQGENIADNGGIREAYEAYNGWIESSGTAEPLLPGLKMTQKQLFWISAANVWCSKERSESLALRVTTGSHSPSRFRVNGPMMNSPHFAADFGCPIGSIMNPVTKCHVW